MRDKLECLRSKAKHVGNDRFFFTTKDWAWVWGKHLIQWLRNGVDSGFSPTTIGVHRQQVGMAQNGDLSMNGFGIRGYNR